MEAFATVDDLQSRWKVLNDEEKARAVVLLGDASALIAILCQKSGIDTSTPDEVLGANLKAVCCEVVRRAMSSPIAVPLSTYQQTAGSYSESFTYANPTGDLYVTTGEKQRLGIGRQRIASVWPYGGADDAG